MAGRRGGKRGTPWSGAELHEDGKFLRGKRQDGEAALAEERELGEGGLGFDRGESDSAGEGLDGFQFDGDPAGFIGGGIGKGGTGDRGETNDGFGGHALVEQDVVAGAHGVEIDAGLVVADAGPGGAAVAHEIGPRVGGGFGFDEPVPGGGREGRFFLGGHGREISASGRR